MLFSAWGRDGVPDTVALGDTLSDEIRRLDPALRLVCTFEADSWEAAVDICQSAWYDDTAPAPAPGRGGRAPARLTAGGCL